MSERRSYECSSILRGFYLLACWLRDPHWQFLRLGLCMRRLWRSFFTFVMSANCSVVVCAWKVGPWDEQYIHTRYCVLFIYLLMSSQHFFFFLLRISFRKSLHVYNYMNAKPLDSVVYSAHPTLSLHPTHDSSFDEPSDLHISHSLSQCQDAYSTTVSPTTLPQLLWQ